MRRERRLAAAVALLAAALACGALAPALDNGFVDYDDDVYITRSVPVSRGLTLDGARWALTSTEAANWFPLTRLSHMADVSLHGLDPRGHHLTSLLLHAANAALVVLVLGAFTGALWAPALAGALFAVHPLHVEPVAWAAERKEVLALLCGLLALAAYRWHVSRPGWRRMAAVAALFALALAAKPVVVTLPCAMLLLDAWPLGRLRGPGLWRRLGALAAEKLPLFALAAAASWLTLVAQARGGATVMTDAPLAVRLVNAAASCARYLGKTLWPARLSFFYPHPDGHWSAAALVGSLALLAAATFLAWRERRRRPWLGLGWLWYLGTLVPMLGIVQVGWQAMADRYTYLPHVGLLAAAAWSVAGAAAALPRARVPVAACCVAALAVFAAQARAQAAVWRDSRTLYAHAVALDPDNWLARQNLGSALVEAGEARAALPHLEAAVRLRPRHANAWYNLGGALYALRRHAEAAAAFERSVGLEHRYADAWANLGAAYFALGRMEDSLAASNRALALDPRQAAAAKNREAAGRLLEAMRRSRR